MKLLKINSESLTFNCFQQSLREEWLESTSWILFVAFAFAFMLAFAVGANDVANSFGTAVGSKVLTMKQAFVLASVFETAGAILLGGSVGATIRNGFLKKNERRSNVTLLMYGQLSAMFGAASWQILATLAKLPVSGTHSIVGAIVGFHVACKGWDGVGWNKLFKIVASWFLSPVIAGIASVAMFWFLHQRVLIPAQQYSSADNAKSEKLALFLLPIFYFATMTINIYALAHHQEKCPSGFLCDMPFYTSPLIAIISGILAAVLSYKFIVCKFKMQWAEELRKFGDQKPNEQIHLTVNQRTSELEEGEKKEVNRTIIDKKLCMPEMNVTPQAPLMTARLLSHIEKNDSFASSRALPSAASMGRIRLTSGGSFTLPPTITSINGRLMSETTDQGIVISPKGGDGEEYEFTEKSSGSVNIDDLDNGVFENDEFDGDIIVEKTFSEKRVNLLFEKLQIMTSCFGAFAHGGNDVSNAIGPLVAVYIYRMIGGLQIPEEVFAPWYLLAFGGLGITAGLWTCGAKLIKAMGEDITTITPVRGFCIELMSAFTVLGASTIGMPVSTTHCKVGSIVAIGIYGRTGVPVKQVINIALAWIVTVPTSALLSFLIMKLLLFMIPIV
ncbi:unnamed protein product [Oikopleura dioica]|uniref:Phosphate transporter n=1 Tax=Oikopleura dioica TaxID=34765 RepID=E4YL90_OIKDI|nr:unnamed protein product [Oikopleura dioica]